MDDLHSATLLLVDDQEPNIGILERILERAGYRHLVSTTDPRLALDLFLERRPDLILLDLHMPHLDGFGVLDQIRPHIPAGSYLPVLVLTADISSEARQRALSSGARDFLGKPFNSVEVVLRIRNLLEARFMHLELQRQNDRLEQKVRERTRELESAQVEILERLALAAEYRDDATHEHTRRVGEISARLARRLGLPDAAVELLRRAAPLHDLGKIAIPDHVLLKMEPLSDDEYSLVRAHAGIGAHILSGSRFPLLQLAESIARTHHERWDGTGYTPGVGGETIPLVGRIVAIADVFDALVHARPYKPAWTVEDALAEIERQRGRQFDPRVVDAFLDLVRHDGLLEVLGDRGLTDPPGVPVGRGAAWQDALASDTPALSDEP
jgi:putative two-component system response regulator